MHACTNEVCFFLSFFLSSGIDGRWSVPIKYKTVGGALPTPAGGALCSLSSVPGGRRERSGRETFVSRTCVLVRDGVSLLDPFVVVVSVAEYTTPCYLSVCMW